MDIKRLSQQYTVKIIEDKDVLSVFHLCEKNPQYYRFCPPMVTVQSVKDDMIALPSGKSQDDKFYIGFWKKDTLVAVMDLILKYPNDTTVFVGFFMMNADLQGNGIATAIIKEAFMFLKQNYKAVRLGYVKGNKQAEHFWKKNGFEPTGVVTKTEAYDIVMMEKML